MPQIFFRELYRQDGTLQYSGTGYKEYGQFVPHGTGKAYNPDGVLKDSCAQHQIVRFETGFVQTGADGPKWVVDRISLYCPVCDWSEEAFPAEETPD